MVIVDADPNSATLGVTPNTIYLGSGGTDELDYEPVDNKVYVTDVADHTVPNISGADQVIYNAKADRFFAAASRWHRGPAIGILDGSGNFITNVPTVFASHQVGYDQTNHAVYTLGGGLLSFIVPR